MEDKQQVQFDHLIVPIQIVNEVLRYLGTKPYDEVVNLIEALRKNSKGVTFPKEDVKPAEAATEPAKAESKKGKS